MIAFPLPGQRSDHSSNTPECCSPPACDHKKASSMPHTSLGTNASLRNIVLGQVVNTEALGYASVNGYAIHTVKVPHAGSAQPT